MNKDIKILAPDLPESINNAIILKWHKKIGDTVQEDELIAEIETDKIILEISSPITGTLYKKLFKVGQKIKSRSIIGYIQSIHLDNNIHKITDKFTQKNKKNYFFTPKMRRLISNNKINKLTIKGIKTHGKITKNKFIINNLYQDTALKKNEKISKKILSEKHTNKNLFKNTRSFRRIPMSPLRKKISERLLSTIQNTAMLTTFNEVNMKPIMLKRQKYNSIFENKYNKLGYMSFYIKAATQALKKFPDINASIEGTDIIYHDYYDINIAISTPRGLITPILKNTDRLSMFEIEKKIEYFSRLGKSGKLQLEDLESGTFTITNGGVFGSLLSTPIINPPQVAILGMHNIKNRPVVSCNKIKIYPMMYLALSYDHQIIDGKQAIQFLNYIKDIIEDFSRIIIDV
ncbi:Dihydrolipoyllysine-residue succinyltransferase component of 2-oxoglutarate dehydrogenase complex [Buchnera aphidicola (Cinara kochiana kochiana)]|uniref:Dihydrolipoyllysine-residue succinyltransferase n=1 Tax=Buchnera aphidicola (Cinara kochiana kochiana) TaxID=2518976 RepID=A0A451D5H4_9GAMM|nr:dihydrolipoyllysine-residue succinyltransferase [Buchnera aphidicola]VFP81110.1 Dihydrolipoyllysine-residue succinyltransferase component of 2-oxoglutarate dehydrogenase complex [Buchnera aphidicola (Cinara kochiana kochiana)]